MIKKPLYVNQLLHVFSNIDMVNILCTLHSQEMRFGVLQDNTSIPKSTLHQQLKRLVDMELVVKTQLHDTNITAYKSNIQSFYVLLDGILEVHMMTKDRTRYVNVEDIMEEIV